jgi:excisionase family DNA binding protein
MSKYALSIKAACSVLSVGKTKIYDLIGKGELRAVHLGGRTVITSDEIDRFLASLRQVKTPSQKQ